MTSLAFAGVCIASILAHELGHAAAARACGDRYGARRWTLNPFANLDPLVSIALPVLSSVLTGGHVAFGVGRPFLVERQRVVVSLAGPAVNVLVAIGCALAGFHRAAWLNAGLALLNLLPVEPLDGWHAWAAWRRKRAST